MKLLMLTVAVCCAVSTTSIGQSITAPQIETAIEAGRTGKEGQLLSSCLATAGFIDRALVGPDLHPQGEHFHVTLTLTAGRIAALAAAAKRRYRPFLPSDVPQELRTLAVFVYAAPHEPVSAAQYVTSPIEHVVLKSKNGVVAQPDEFKTARVEWPGIAGGRAQPNRAAARFPIGRVRELPAGEFNIVLVTQAGERSCKVGAKDRERLFGGR